MKPFFPNSPEGVSLLNTGGLIFLAFLSWMKNRKIDKLAKKTTEEAEKVNKSVGEVKDQVTAVQKVMDGPFSLSLKNAAVLSARIALLTGDPLDQKRADDAAAIHENRQRIVALTNAQYSGEILVLHQRIKELSKSIIEDASSPPSKPL